MHKPALYRGSNLKLSVALMYGITNGPSGDPGADLLTVNRDACALVLGTLERPFELADIFLPNIFFLFGIQILPTKSH